MRGRMSTAIFTPAPPEEAFQLESQRPAQASGVAGTVARGRLSYRSWRGASQRFPIGLAMGATTPDHRMGNCVPHHHKVHSRCWNMSADASFRQKITLPQVKPVSDISETFRRAFDRCRTPAGSGSEVQGARSRGGQCPRQAAQWTNWRQPTSGARGRHERQHLRISDSGLALLRR